MLNPAEVAQGIVASQVVSAEKRFRMSLLLDAYGELLTEKQRAFMKRYFEDDLSFGEIAREHGVSRQAIFDSVKHGEESLERLERVLSLVETGWLEWQGTGLSPRGVAARLTGLRDRLTGGADEQRRQQVAAGLSVLLRELRLGGETAETETLERERI